MKHTLKDKINVSSYVWNVRAIHRDMDHLDSGHPSVVLGYVKEYLRNNRMFFNDETTGYRSKMEIVDFRDADKCDYPRIQFTAEHIITMQYDTFAKIIQKFDIVIGRYS